MDRLLSGCYYCRNSTSPSRMDPEERILLQICHPAYPKQMILIVEDQIPNKHLFAVTIKTPWYVDVANYLAVGKLPAHISLRERKLIIQNNAQFTWIVLAANNIVSIFTSCLHRVFKFSLLVTTFLIKRHLSLVAFYIPAFRFLFP
jgi:hypothetical protein